jgi:protein-L-isoaspartate(D-aspartate) O-methyltransferase
MAWGQLLGEMVDSLVADGYVSSPRVEAAFRAVPRHHFLPGEPLATVYDPDRAVVTRVDHDGVPVSSSSAPDIMGAMLERLGVEPGDRVLEIGTGTGYNAALLSLLVTPSGSVTSIDIDPAVTAAARLRLRDRGLQRVTVVDGDGWPGWAAGAPYDRIEVTVGVWDLSPHWLGQLREGGTLVLPLWLRAGTEALVAFERRGARLVSRTVDQCGFMRLRGPHAGPERHLRVERWLAALEGASAEDPELLARLLRRPVAEERLDGELPDGWYARLSFDEPGAIMLASADDPIVQLLGLYDRATRSLALVGDGRVRAHGGDAALRRLRDRLPGLRRHPLDLRRLHIEAIPTSTTDADAGASRPTRRPGSGTSVLGRPSFDLVVRETIASA